MEQLLPSLGMEEMPDRELYGDKGRLAHDWHEAHNQWKSGQLSRQAYEDRSRQFLDSMLLEWDFSSLPPDVLEEIHQVAAAAFLHSIQTPHSADRRAIGSRTRANVRVCIQELLAAEEGYRGRTFMLPNDITIDPPDNDLIVERDFLADRLEDVLDLLPDIEGEVIRRRFGIGYSLQTMDEVAAEMGLTRSRIHALEARALLKLRQSERNKPLRGFAEVELE